LEFNVIPDTLGARWRIIPIDEPADDQMGQNQNYMIVGSGVAGGLIAEGLLKKGAASVTMLEAGPAIKMRDYRKWIDMQATGFAPYDDCRDKLDEYENKGSMTLDFPESRLFARGGTTLHWTGACPRLKPEDFARKTNTGIGVDWPIDYRTLEPYYNQAEAVIGVSGDAGKTSCPRSAPYPLPAIVPTMMDKEISRGCEALGWSWEALPIARNVKPVNGMPACQTTGTCRYCPIGARFSADMILDRLEQTKAFSLIRGAALRVTMRNRNQAAGVEYLDIATQQIKNVEADRIIICAGAIESAKLLLASQSAYWKQGLGNDSGHVGQHLVVHPFLEHWAVLKENPRKLVQELQFPTWCSRQFDTPETQRAGKLLIFVPPAGPHFDFPRMIAEGKSPDEIETAIRGPARMMFAGLFEMEAGDGSRIELAEGKTRFGLPRTRVHFHWEKRSLETALSYKSLFEKLIHKLGWEPGEFRVEDTAAEVRPRADHATGICRMSRDDADGVVDPSLRVFGTENVWVCSNGVFPSNGAANPTITLASLSLRLVDSLTTYS
jgi:choline dehydrogenase-like flavoprotein